MSEYKPGDWIGGQYRVRRVFGGKGKSGMGVVYLVEGRSSDEPFVLKTFQPTTANDSSLARFKREAEAWVSLGRHPNIVPCLWVSELSKQLFVAAEYVVPNPEGQNTLTAYLKGARIAINQQVNWIAQFCYGMRHAARRGLKVHRDIKPDNMMVDGQGRLRVTDFGLVKLSGSTEVSPELRGRLTPRAGITHVGTILGTPPFMAPEQFQDAANVDFRSDIYSWGVIMYVMLSGGHLPIAPEGSQPFGVQAWAIAHMRQAVKAVDSPLMAICSRCLEKDREKRFQSYDDLLRELGAMCRRQGIALPKEEQLPGADMEAEFTRCMTMRMAGKNAGALALLRSVEKAWPGIAKVQTEIGLALLGLGQLQEALDATEAALRIDPTRTAAWNNYGVILTRLQKHDQAKTAFGKALQIEPENDGAMFQLAQLEIAAGNLSTAKTLCELALFWRPEKPNVLKVASECFLRAGEMDRAGPLLQRLLSLEPEDATAWFNLSLYHKSKGRSADQIIALKQMLKRRPADGEALNFLIQAHTDLLQMDEAIAACGLLQKVPGWEVIGVCKEAQLLAHAGRGMAAYQLLTQWLKRYERSASLWFSLAVVLRPMAQYRQQALVAAQNALQCHQENPKQLSIGNVQVLQNLASELARHA